MKIEFEYKKDCCSFCDPQTEGKISWLGVDKIKGYTIKKHGMIEEGGGIYLESGCLYGINDDPCPRLRFRTFEDKLLSYLR